jgi:hypothetical protein
MGFLLLGKYNQVIQLRFSIFAIHFYSMAKSYLYTTDDYTATGADFKAKGLSEYEDGISYLYQLMVSYDTQSIKSKQVDERVETAVVADFEKGKELVIEYLKMVRAIGLDYMEEGFEDFVDETIAFLNARTAKYVVLENREVYALDEDEVAETLQRDFLEITNDDRARVEKAIAEFKKGNVDPENPDDENADYLDMLAEEDLNGFWKK